MADTHDIAAQLGETSPQPIGLIGRIVRRLGHVQAGALLDRTLALEAEGGMLTSDGTRRRTPGGVFFALVKQYLEESGQSEAAQALFPPRQRRPKRRAEPAAPVAAPAPPGAVMRPRLKGRPGAPLPAPRLPRTQSAPAPAEVQPADSNSALAAARRLLTAAMGCYAIGAQQETHMLRVRFDFPATARERYAEQLDAVEIETGWQVELHPAPHQGRLAEAARLALPPGLEPAGMPSLRAPTQTALVRARGAAAPAQIEAAQRLFREQTGWQLEVEQLEP